MFRIILFSTACLLVGAFAVRIGFSMIPLPEPTLERPLAQILPESIPGWSVRTVPMSQSEEASARITNFLNFDDAIFRIYERGDTMVGIYVAYWTPGKTSYRWAGVHTPDTCWVQAGWTRLDRHSQVDFGSSQTALKPSEFGTFAKDGTTQHVYFWHLVGGEPYGYQQSGLHNIFASLHDVRHFGLDLRREQFFIRVSSNHKVADLKDIPGFDRIVQSLTEIGLEPVTGPAVGASAL